MTVELDRQRVVDTLINALEGGSHYWIEMYKFNSNGNIEHVLKEVMKGEKTLTVTENDRKEDSFEVTSKTIEAALQDMANRYPWHFKNLVDENDDAETADVLLQLAALKEIVYG